MYIFKDRNEDLISLRPEGTAGTVRGLVSNGFLNSLPKKLFYFGPMFRHERPQKGRLRQFDQFGVEIYGIFHPTADVECIHLAWKFIQDLQLDGDSKILINTLGDSESRLKYKNALVSYFEKNQDKLSKDSIARLDKNPLRILDSKDPGDIEIVNGSPDIFEFLSLSSIRRYEFIESSLKELDIPFKRVKSLVRGLDYYDHTVWEVVSNSARLGRSQNTILAGGRYNNLVKLFGGSSQTPGIGWAAGVERLSYLLNNEEAFIEAEPVSIILVPETVISNESDSYQNKDISYKLMAMAMKVSTKLSSSGIRSNIIHTTSGGVSDRINYPSLSKQLNAANKMQSKSVVIIGENEIMNDCVVLKDFTNNSQTTCKVSELPEKIRGI
ncbi:Histidine-tRNA ligase [Smittium culicis]|uniref:histidine--tRNA ligase n=1 Tax=Smittium culicis TaxID=133412 RepID=A0A1R1XLV9_9FUNG|nr:Histidine-tRNA ligase [Smittium culicis]